jgi:hypothetical protein
MTSCCADARKWGLTRLPFKLLTTVPFVCACSLLAPHSSYSCMPWAIDVVIQLD